MDLDSDLRMEKRKKMVYRVEFTISQTAYVEVRARNKEEAEKLAKEIYSEDCDDSRIEYYSSMLSVDDVINMEEEE